MTYPNDLKYTKEHEWIKIEGNKGIIGVTKYAIEQLGDVVYLDLPKIGAQFKANETFGTIESTKTVSDLYIPVTCKVEDVNKNIVDNPETLAEDAYTKGWLIKVEITETPTNLLSSSEYAEYLKNNS